MAINDDPSLGNFGNFERSVASMSLDDLVDKLVDLVEEQCGPDSYGTENYDEINVLRREIRRRFGRETPSDINAKR